MKKAPVIAVAIALLVGGGVILSPLHSGENTPVEELQDFMRSKAQEPGWRYVVLSQRVHRTGARSSIVTLASRLWPWNGFCTSDVELAEYCFTSRPFPFVVKVHQHDGEVDQIVVWTGQESMRLAEELVEELRRDFPRLDCTIEL